MQTQLPTHPTRTQLAAFAAGKLEEDQVEAVAKHLDACPACSKVAATIPPDSISERLQAGHRPIRAASWSSASPSLQGALSGSIMSVPMPLPAELAEHPKYRIVRELGHGGMGVVYLADHRIMERQVAIKVINKALIENVDAVQRFHSEVRAAAKLGHPNIVQAFDAEQAGDLHFLVMEYVEGKSLAELVERRRKPLSIQHACHFIWQAAQGLQHAHEKQMVHRDIKPHNLMITLDKGKIKILDFGLARMVRERTALGGGLTSADSFMGTPEYVAPEQAEDARQADIRADLYSLGCTLYFLLASRPPFREETAMKVVLAHVNDQPKPLPEIRTDVPAELWAIVQKLLAKNPNGRYQTPAELAQALMPLAKNGSSAPPPADLQKPISSPGRATQMKIETSKIMKSKLVGEAKQASQPLGGSPKKTNLEPPIQKHPWEPWLLPAVAAIGFFLVVGLVAGIVLRLKTKDGTIVIENLTPDSHVFIDQEKVTFTLIDGHKIVIDHVIRGQKHKLRVTRDGFKTIRREDELEFDGRRRQTRSRRLGSDTSNKSVVGPTVGQTDNPSKIPGIMPPSESTKDVAKTPNTPTTGRVESEDAKSKTQESSSLSDLLRAGTELTGDWMGLANPQGGEVKIQIKERDGKKLKGIHSANFKDGQWFHWDMEGEVVADTFNYHSVGSVHKYYTTDGSQMRAQDCISGQDNVPALKMMPKLPSELKEQAQQATPVGSLRGRGSTLRGL